MHWLNGYAEAYMRVMKIATRVRFLQMIGKFLDDVSITVSTMVLICGPLQWNMLVRANAPSHLPH